MTPSLSPIQLNSASTLTNKGGEEIQEIRASDSQRILVSYQQSSANRSMDDVEEMGIGADPATGG